MLITLEQLFFPKRFPNNRVQKSAIRPHNLQQAGNTSTTYKTRKQDI